MADVQAETQAAPPGSLLTDLVAGSFGGAAQVIVGQPLDTLKTRAQTAPAGRFKNTLDILKQTVAREGVLGLYKGMASPLMGIAAVNAALFTAYGQAKRVVNPYGPTLTIGQTALAGGMAGAANAVLASPVELFKVKMQGQYGGATDKRLSAVFLDQYRNHGFRHGIMRGFWATFFREIPAYAGFYSAYEFSKRHLSRPSALGEGMLTYLVSGALGGVAYWLACYPLDVVKSTVQLREARPSPGVGYVWREMGAIVREGGVSRLFKGINPTLIRSVPAAASTFLVFEVTKAFIEEKQLL